MTRWKLGLPDGWMGDWLGRVVTGTLTFLWKEGFRDLIWESFWARWFGGGVLSSGVQVGSLLPPLASCELACDPTVCPRCSLPSAQWAKSTCSVLSMNYLWMQTGVISGVLRPWLSFLLTALLLLSISFKDWEEGESNRFLVTFLQWEWGYDRAT